MKKIFVGLLLICFNLNLNRVFTFLPPLDLLPDFIGHILLYLGIPELARESGTLDRLRKLQIGFAVVSVASWLTNAIWPDTTSFATFLLSLGLSLAVMVQTMYTLYQVARGYEELESVKHRGEKMHHDWKMIPYLLVLIFLFYMVLGYFSIANEPWLTILLLLVIVGLLIAILVFYVHYLVQAYRAMREYVPAQAIVSIQPPEDNKPL